MPSAKQMQAMRDLVARQKRGEDVGLVRDRLAEIDRIGQAPAPLPNAKRDRARALLERTETVADQLHRRTREYNPDLTREESDADIRREAEESPDDLLAAVDEIDPGLLAGVSGLADHTRTVQRDLAAQYQRQVPAALRKAFDKRQLTGQEEAEHDHL